MQDGFSRRSFIIQAAYGAGSLLATATILPSLLSGCKKQEARATSDSTPKSVPCAPGEVISEESLKARAAVKYVEQSPIGGRNCANCKLYQAAVAPSPCGGCMLFAGAVNPAGYCASWYQRM